MIAVIGGAKATVRIKITPPKGDENGEPIAKPAGRDEIEVINSGCGCNIAKHLVGYDQEVAYISAIGEDIMGVAVVEELKACGIDVSGIKKIPGTTPVQVEMINILGDLEYLKCNEVILENITPELIKENRAIIDKAEIIVMDGSIPTETIEAVANEYGDKAKIFFDPANKEAGEKIKNVFDKIYCVMPGRMEAENMTGLTILDQDQLMAAGAYLEEKGIDRTIITMKGGGVYYKHGINEGVIKPERVLSFAQTTGAGDVVSAAVVMGEINNKSIEVTAEDAMACAAEFLRESSDERPIDKYSGK